MARRDLAAALAPAVVCGHAALPLAAPAGGTALAATTTAASAGRGCRDAPSAGCRRISKGHFG